jgi:hypothetical protein
MRVLLHGAVYSRGLTTPSQYALNGMLVATAVAVCQTTLSGIAPPKRHAPSCTDRLSPAMNPILRPRAVRPEHEYAGGWTTIMSAHEKPGAIFLTGIAPDWM